jgi:hypothetical protein
MSDINLDFTVSNNSINFTVEPNDITITPTDVQLTVFAAGLGVPGGNVNELQYNDSGLLGGVANTSFSGGNLTLGDISNIKINGGNNSYILSTDGTGNLSWTNPGNIDVANTALNLNANSTSNVIIGGGVNGYVLQTDGVGNLSWTAQTGGNAGNGVPGGSNRQIQYNDSGSFGGTPFFTFDEATGDVVVPNNLSLGSGFPLGGGNILGNSANFIGAIVGNTISGNIIASNLSVSGLAVGSFASVSSIRIGGGLANYILITDGTGNLSWNSGVANANVAGFANFAGNVTISNQPNITSLGTLIGLSINGNANIGNIGTTTLTASGNITAANFIGNALTANTANTVTNNAQPNITSTGILTSVSVSGNANVGNLNATNSIGAGGTISAIGNIGAGNLNTSGVLRVNGASFSNIANSLQVGGNLSVGLNILLGNANSTIQTAGNITAAGTMNAGNGYYGAFVNILGSNSYIQTGGYMQAGNYVTASTLRSTVATGTPPLQVTSTTLVANLNVGTAGTVTTGAQPNITSLGTLTNLSVTGNINMGTVSPGTGNINMSAGNLFARYGTFGGANTGLIVTNTMQAAGANIANIYNPNGNILSNRTTSQLFLSANATSTFTFASLPAASGNATARSAITDANTTTFNAIVGGGGTNVIPVFSDGTNWRIG